MVIFDSGRLAKDWRDRQIVVYSLDDGILVFNTYKKRYSLRMYKDYLPFPDWHDTTAVVRWLNKLENKHKKKYNNTS